MSDHLSSFIAARLSRRGFLSGAAALGAASAMPSLLTARAGAPGLAFAELERVGKDSPTHRVAPGYTATALIAWGEPILPGAPAFDPANQSAAKQQVQFGYNCDFIGYLPLDEGAGSKAGHLKSANGTHGLLGVNHEYSFPPLMFAGIASLRDGFEKATAESAAIERASLGFSVIEVKRTGNDWAVVGSSPYARRLHGDSIMEIAGPARGHARMKSAQHGDGLEATGTFANCAGGVTPWGTFLSAEENIQNYFSGVPGNLAPEYSREALSMESFGVNARAIWSKFEDRFDVNKDPYAFNHYGWMVEIDPYDPASIPKKRTALGRFRHEAATIVAVPGKPVVAYMGDDQANEHVYKFVSARTYNADDPAANTDILDEGVLYAAVFEAEGKGRWARLVHGEGPLTPANGFESQGDVVIDARRAAKLLGATETDRPEDIETDPVTGRTYVAFTSNTSRLEAVPASPRAPNPRGHIVEILAPGEDGARDHTREDFTWDVLLLAGHPGADRSAGGVYGPGVSDAGWFANPDNLAFDPQGRLWIATDGSDEIGLADGIWACSVTGPERATTRHFFACPRGAEMCGPCFTPDGRTLFVAVQHPGQEDDSSFDAPTTRWPAGPESAMPPRPAVVAIVRDDGGVIGG